MNILHFRFQSFVPPKELRHLFASVILRKIAVTLLGIFSGVYVYQIALQTWGSQRFAIIFAVLFYLCLHLTKAVFLVLSHSLTHRVGAKYTMRLSAIPFVLSVGAFLIGDTMPLFLPIAGALWGANAGMYWWGYHVLFAKKGTQRKLGLEAGEEQLLERILLIAVPVVGGVAAVYVGFWSVFVLSGLAVIASVFALGRSMPIQTKHVASFKGLVDLTVQNKLLFATYAAAGVQGKVAGFVWPLFLFLFFGQVLSLGAIVSLASLAAALLSVWIGNVIDTKTEKVVMRLGAPITALSWILRIVFQSFGGFVVGDALWLIGFQMGVLPLDTLSYKRSKEWRTAYSIAFRESGLIVGVVFASLFIIITILLGMSLLWSFGLAGIVSLIPLLAIWKHEID